MQLNTFPITLETSYMITPKVKHFIFTCDLSPAFHFKPGQFITIHFEHQGKTLRRSYSIANAPMQDNRIEFAAGFFEHGPGTELLFNLKPRDVIHINGPFGRLILRDEIPGRYILIATSTGITPYRAMIQELGRRVEQNSELEVVILQGVQKREEILYPDEFTALAAKHPRIKFRAHLSRELSQELKDHEFKGYVQYAFPELNLNPDKDIVYLCGNPSMIDDSFNYLKDQGFTPQHIIREKYISS